MILLCLNIYCVSKQQLETEAVTTEVKCMCAQTKKNATNLGYQNTSKKQKLLWCAYTEFH